MNLRTFTYILWLLLLTFGVLLSGCQEDGPAPLEIPDTYDGSGFMLNAAREMALTTQLSILTSTMQAGRSGAAVSATDLQTQFDLGSPSLADITNPYYADLITRTDGWFVNLAAASGGSSFDPATAPAGDGGTLGGYLFEENGLELEQMIEKGLFGAALYNEASTIMNGDLTAADVDRLVALWGARPAFVNSDKSDPHGADADAFLAKYAARRDQADGNGLYTRTRDAFIKLQAALAGGEDYRSERDDALNEIQMNWEKANFATVVNYLQATISKLSQTNPEPATVGSALHSYGEAVGFTHGWRQLASPTRNITDEEIDLLLGYMNAPAGATPTSYLLATDSFNELQDLQAAIELIQSIYGFSDAEIESFEKNWVNEQGR